jgi:uncharacterized protein YaaN involved in tellurite resistance
MTDKTPIAEELEEIKVTGMIAPLRDKLTRLKKNLKRLLSQPKHERNTKMIKKLLKEAKSVRKIIKKYSHQEMTITCPHCGLTHNVTRSE